MNIHWTKIILKTALLAILFLLSACDSSSTDAEEDYVLENACVDYIVPVDLGILPVATNDPVFDASGLSSVISFDYSERLSGEVPVPSATAGGLNFANIAVTDKSIQSLFISGDVPEGKRIAVVYVGLESVGEYFVVPIDANQGTGAAGELPLEITMRGPFPIEGTDPEPDIIQAQIVSNLNVVALLVDIDAPTPDLTADLSALEADAANWLAPVALPTITAENVGSGNVQVTLFWNSDVDLDLWLIEPDGNKIFYQEPISVAGDGFLDFDDVDGFGPENIFYITDIPEGAYEVQVNYFSGSVNTSWSISVTACGSTATFSGRLENVGDVDNLFSFIHGPDCELDIPESKDPRDEATVFDEAVLCSAP